MALGLIFGGFGVQVGGEIGGKLAPKSKEIGVPRRCQKNHQKIVDAMVRGGTRVNLVQAPKESLRDSRKLEY